MAPTQISIGQLPEGFRAADLVIEDLPDRVKATRDLNALQGGSLEWNELVLMAERYAIRSTFGAENERAMIDGTIKRELTSSRQAKIY